MEEAKAKHYLSTLHCNAITCFLLHGRHLQSMECKALNACMHSFQFYFRPILCGNEQIRALKKASSARLRPLTLPL